MIFTSEASTNWFRMSLEKVDCKSVAGEVNVELFVSKHIYRCLQVKSSVEGWMSEGYMWLNM